MTAFVDAAGRVWDRTWSYRALGPLERDRDQRNEKRRFLSDHPGHPLGPGMPLGSALRIEVFSQRLQMWRGESHLMWWERITRGDPCAFCGEMIHYSTGHEQWMLGAGTVDHIEPKTLPIRAVGGAHSWINVAAACERCNGSKGRKRLLDFLWHRSPYRVRRRPAPEVRLPATPTRRAA